MKLGLFSDPHYSALPSACQERKNNQSLRKMQEAVTFFEQEKCDLAVCLGDLTDTDATHEKERENLKEIGRLLESAPFPVYCLMGNHDAFTFETEEFYDILGKDFRPRNVHEKNLHLLFMDACYFSDGRHYRPRDTNWLDTFFPFADALEDKIRNCTGRIYLFVHQNLDSEIPKSHVLSNAPEIRRMLSRYPGVQAVYQGHYHPGYQSVSQGIRYITLPAMCEFEGAFTTIEL